jgi:hypothetical protein
MEDLINLFRLTYESEHKIWFTFEEIKEIITKFAEENKQELSPVEFIELKMNELGLNGQCVQEAISEAKLMEKNKKV